MKEVCSDEVQKQEMKEIYESFFKSTENFLGSKKENTNLNNNFTNFVKHLHVNSAKRLFNLHSQLKIVFKRELKTFIYECNPSNFTFDNFFLQKNIVAIQLKHPENTKCLLNYMKYSTINTINIFIS